MAAAEETTSTISTAGGTDVDVRRFRAAGPGADARPAVVWFHGLVGLADEEPALRQLAEAGFDVHAPIWPGYGPLENEGSVEDMLDFALLGWDIVDGIGLEAKPHLIGHSFGAMIAAEMACVARRDLERLVLLAPFGLWLDGHPIPDPFAVLPFQLAELLLADPDNAAKLVRRGQDLSTDEGLAEFMVANSRRLGTAGKIMFPIPNRRLSKRLYRLSAPTLVMAAEADALITAPYIEAWVAAVANARSAPVSGAGHLANLEQPDAVAATITAFLNETS